MLLCSFVSIEGIWTHTHSITMRAGQDSILINKMWLFQHKEDGLPKILRAFFNKATPQRPSAIRITERGHTEAELNWHTDVVQHETARNDL